jgi:hypothetical protein
MRPLLAAALLAVAQMLVATRAVADDAPKAMSITLEPLGDRDGTVVTLVYFRFANPRRVTAAGLFLEGTFVQAGELPSSFRFAVPRSGDKMHWYETVSRNGKVVRRRTKWAMLPDKRNEMSVEHVFTEGAAEVNVWLVLEGDGGDAQQIIAKGTQTFTIARTNKAYVAPVAEEAEVEAEGVEEPEVVQEADEAEEAAEAVEYDEVGPVEVRGTRCHSGSGLYPVRADVQPPVKRVEFWVDGKKIVARNAPPYTAELEIGDAKRSVRAIAYDAAGKFVDDDTFIVNDDATDVCGTLRREDERPHPR